MSLAIPHDHGALCEEALQDVEDPSRNSHVMEDGEEVAVILPIKGIVVIHCCEDDTLAVTKVQVVVDEGEDFHQEMHFLHYLDIN